MKLTVLQENLKNAVTTTSHFISPKAQLPILGNILIKTDKSKLILSSTNLETSVSTSIGAKIEKEGEITVPGRIFNDVISNLSSGTIEIEVEKEQIKITSGTFKSNILGVNSSDFPIIPNSIGKNALTLPKNKFLEGLNKTLFAVSIDETRPVLTGILFVFKGKNLHLVSTDGFRLSQKTIKLEKEFEDQKIIVPKTILLEISKLGSNDDISFSFSKKDNQIVFVSGVTVFSSRVIEGEYPDFEKILPKSSVLNVLIDKEDFEKAVKLASVFSRDAGNILKLSIDKNILKVIAESSNSGNQETNLEVKVEKKSEFDGGVEISFNYRFIEEVLRVISSDDILIEFGGPNTPGKFIDNKDTDFLHLIMPIKT
jgi:DNA polymerase-3 subunit beta